MFLVFNREMPLFFPPNPKGREGILLQQEEKEEEVQGLRDRRAGPACPDPDDGSAETHALLPGTQAPLPALLSPPFPPPLVSTFPTRVKSC